MKQLNLAEAKAKLSYLVDQAARGKGVIIAKSGTPMAKLVPIDDGAPRKFKFGTLKGILSRRNRGGHREPAARRLAGCDVERTDRNALKTSRPRAKPLLTQRRKSVYSVN